MGPLTIYHYNIYVTCGVFGKFREVDSSKLLHETDSFNKDVGVVAQVGGTSSHHFADPHRRSLNWITRWWNRLRIKWHLIKRAYIFFHPPWSRDYEILPACLCVALFLGLNKSGVWYLWTELFNTLLLKIYIFTFSSTNKQKHS